jgi:hypothetical protein
MCLCLHSCQHCQIQKANLGAKKCRTKPYRCLTIFRDILSFYRYKLAYMLFFFFSVLLGDWYTHHILHSCLVCVYPNSAGTSVLLQWKQSRCYVQVKVKLTPFSNYDAANIIIQSSRPGLVERLLPGLRSVIYLKLCVAIYVCAYCIPTNTLIVYHILV